MRVDTAPISDGNRGIADTLRVMRRLVDKALLDPAVIETAHSIVRGLPARAYDAEARAILDWVRGHFRYTRDPLPYDPDVGPADQVKTPGRLLMEIRQNGVAIGDCDDYVMLLETLLRAVGIEAQSVVVSMDGGLYSHVLERYKSPAQGRWITLDAITSNPPGWFPQGTTAIASFEGGGLVDQTEGSVQGYYDAAAVAYATGRATRPTGAGALGCGDCGGACGSCSSRGVEGLTATPRRSGWSRPIGRSPRIQAKSGAALAGYLVDEPAKMPNDPVARFSRRLSPYTDLLWFLWAGASLAAAAGVLHHVRRGR